MDFILELVKETNNNTILFMLKQTAEKVGLEKRVEELTKIIETIQKATKYSTIGTITDERDALKKQVKELELGLKTIKERNAVLTDETAQLRDIREFIRAELEKSRKDVLKTVDSIGENTAEIKESLATLLGESSEIIGILTEVPENSAT